MNPLTLFSQTKSLRCTNPWRATLLLTTEGKPSRTELHNKIAGSKFPNNSLLIAQLQWFDIFLSVQIYNSKFQSARNFPEVHEKLV